MIAAFQARGNLLQQRRAEIPRLGQGQALVRELGQGAFTDAFLVDLDPPAYCKRGWPIKLRSQACSESHVGTSSYLNNAASRLFEATVLIVAQFGVVHVFDARRPYVRGMRVCSRRRQLTIARRMSPPCTSRETPSGRLQFERVGIARECGPCRFAVPARGGM